MSQKSTANAGQKLGDKKNNQFIGPTLYGNNTFSFEVASRGGEHIPNIVTRNYHGRGQYEMRKNDAP